MNITSLNELNNDFHITSNSTTKLKDSSNNLESRQAEKITLSQESQKLSRQEQYSLKTDPVEMFLEWKNSGVKGPVLGLSLKPEEDLLPENQELINDLRKRITNSRNNDEKLLLLGNIETVRAYGDKEIFTNESDITKKDYAIADSATLQLNYLANKNGHIPKADEVLGKNYKPLELFNTGYYHEDNFDQKKASPEYMAHFDDQAFLNKLLTQIRAGQV